MKCDTSGRGGQSKGQAGLRDEAVGAMGAVSARRTRPLRPAPSSGFSGKTIHNTLNSAAPLKTVFPTTGIGNQLARVARIIAARNNLTMNRHVFFRGQGGYDNHNHLLPGQSAFYQATEEMGVSDSVATVTESEFGRTFNSNTGFGSDHAWGSHHIVLGGSVKGGVCGKLPLLLLGQDDGAGTRGLWIPSTSLDQYEPPWPPGSACQRPA